MCQKQESKKKHITHIREVIDLKVALCIWGYFMREKEKLTAVIYCNLQKTEWCSYCSGPYSWVSEKLGELSHHFPISSRKLQFSILECEGNALLIGKRTCHVVNLLKTLKHKTALSSHFLSRIEKHISLVLKNIEF